MYVQLGSKPVVDQSDVLALFLDCHTRIRSFTALAGRLARAQAATPEEVQETAERIHRYFTQALPLHVEDEEQSLAPRLRGLEPAIDQALERMESQHRDHAPLLAQLRRRLEALLAAPAELPAQAGPLAALAAELQTQFEAHLTLEETVLFPAAARLLDPAARAAMVGELRGRRGVEPGPGQPHD